jgi:acyl carrier protein
MTATPITLNPTTEETLAEIAAMLSAVLADIGPDPVDITMETSFNDDLELESIDMVSLAVMLNARWGDRVNFAEFVAGKHLDELIALKVGDLVYHVLDGLTVTTAIRR